MSYLFRKFNILKPSTNIRVFKKIKSLLKLGPSQSDLLHGAHLQDLDQFQYPNKLQETTQKVPKNPEEEQEVLVETEKIVSDLERARLQELDKIYGTNTYFHPINEVFEERLDSEHVMERQRSKRKHLNQSLQASRFFEFDPQEKIRAPKIKNKMEFYKNLKKLMVTPIYEKMGTVTQNKFEILTDHFTYLDEKSLADPTQKIQVNSPEHMKIVEYVTKENLLSEMSFFLNAQLEDKIIKDYNDSIGTDNRLPIYYENALYYNKESTGEGLNLYRLRIDDNTSNTLAVKYMAQSSPNEENIFTQKELIDFLTEYANSKDNVHGRIPHDLVISLKYNEDRFELYDVVLSNNQQLLALTFSMNVVSESVFNKNITIVKNIENNKFYNMILDHTENEIVFDDLGGIYYIKKNETGRAGFLYRYDLNASDPKTAERVIVEEGDPMFELSVQKTISNEYLILNSSTASGDPINEVYIRPLNDPYQEFQLLIPRSKGLEYKVKHSKDYLILLIQDHIEETQTTKKIRIINEKSSQNLLEAGEKIGEQMLQLTATGLVFKSSEQKTKLESLEEDSKSQIKSKALVVARLHGLEKKKEPQNIYGSLEDFPITEPGEKITYFAGFENYVVFHIRNADKEYLKVYNHRSDKIHTLKFNEEGAQLASEFNHRYRSPFYHFHLNTPNAPLKVLSYNLGLRDLQVIHTEHIVGFKAEDYTLEKITITARDGKEIPVSFVYNNKRMQSESPVILHVELDLESRAYMNFKPEILGLLDRGCIVAYPHVRGSKDLDEDWFNQGSGIKRLTSVTDVIDTASYLLVNEVTPNICLYGKGELGGLISTVAVLKEPELFSATVLEDPIADLVSYLFDHNNKKNNAIFGDINDKDIYEHTKEYSPYHNEISNQLANLLVISNANANHAADARKLIAKIRDKLQDKNNYHKIFFRELPPENPEIFKTALWQAFMINSVYKQDKLV